LGLTIFAIYSIAVVAMGADYVYRRGGGRYLSPFYSPDLKSFGLHLPFTYAFFVIWAPLGLRATCYYYRKAYYRAFFLAPPGCAVAGLQRRRYAGETRFPFVLQNAHRFFFYLAVVVLGFLWFDAVRSFFFRSAGGSYSFGVGLGSLIMVANVVLLSMFTFGCNSFRHLIGGKLDCFTCSPAARTRHRLWLSVCRFWTGPSRYPSQTSSRSPAKDCPGVRCPEACSAAGCPDSPRPGSCLRARRPKTTRQQSPKPSSGAAPSASCTNTLRLER
jgi:hypothetical protein